MQSHALGERLCHLKGHFAIEYLEVLVCSKLSMTQQCTVTAKGTNNLSIAKYHQQAQGSDPSHLLTLNKTHQECNVQVWASQYKGNKNILEHIQRWAKEVLKEQQPFGIWGETEGDGLVQHEKSQGDLISMYKYLMGWHKKAKPHSQWYQWQNKSQWTQVERRKIPFKQKYLKIVRVTEYRNRLSRGGAEPLS